MATFTPRKICSNARNFSQLTTSEVERFVDILLNKINYKSKSMLPKERVQMILTEGAKETCDELNRTFRESADKVPEDFDGEKFKRGQAFYHKYIYSMFLGKLLGLVTLLSIPSVLDILIFTNMSSEPLTAYKRYLATVFHMRCWYDGDFKPGSKLWKSLKSVRNMHNTASKRCKLAKNCYISQKDMALTQFGFMGYAVLDPEHIGIFGKNKEGFESFVYMWRTIGKLMGIDDRYNICRESLEETRAICKEIVREVFLPYNVRQDERFYKMADALLTGMWTMNPMLETDAILNYLYRSLNKQAQGNEQIPMMPMKTWGKIILVLLHYYIRLMQFRLWRYISNFLQYLTFWLMVHFPFLSYYKYGYKHSHVDIHIQDSRSGKSG